MADRVEQVTIEARYRGYRKARPMTTNLDLDALDLPQRLDSILEGFAGSQDQDLCEWSLDVRPVRSPDFVHQHTGADR